MRNQTNDLPLLKVSAWNKCAFCLETEKGRFGHNALFSLQSKMFKNPECTQVRIDKIRERDGE